MWIQGENHQTGIIPAYAGSTPRAFQPISSSWDHPRIRGEHAKRMSPVLLRWRIIPAYAGSTSRVSQSIHLEPDHPRIRGEHVDSMTSSAILAGSSPHTRGALLANAASITNP